MLPRRIINFIFSEDSRLYKKIYHKFNGYHKESNRFHMNLTLRTLSPSKNQNTKINITKYIVKSLFVR